MTRVGDVTADGPGRFVQPYRPPRRSPGRVLAAGTVLLVLLAGIPVGLLVLTGAPPVPTSWPTREWVQRPLAARHLVAVLVGLVWVLWLQFAVGTVVEAVGALRGRALVPSLPLGGPTQRLARALVAAVVVGTALTTPAAAAVTPARPTAVTAQLPPDPAAHPVTAASVAPASTEPARAGQVTAGREAASDDPLAGRRVYEVRSPRGRCHDSLWAIAETHLGDGRRYPEIYRLNRGRRQPDGRSLHLARLIHPGWLLVMPEDAVGVPRYGSHPRPAGPEGVSASGTGARPDGGTGAGTDGPDGNASGGGGAGDAPRAARGAVPSSASSPATELGGAGLLAAGVLAALVISRRRGRHRDRDPGPEAVEAEVWLRVGARPDRAHLLDRALRGLGAACRQAGTAPPAAYAGLFGESELELLLFPPAPVAPSPWTALDGGARWRLDLAALPRAAATGHCPYPALVALGRDVDGRDVLLDLGAAAGPVSVLGGEAAGQVVRALAIELATNAWSDRVRVTAVDLPPALAAVGVDRLHVPAPGGTGHEAIRERLGTPGLPEGVLSGTWSPSVGPVEHLVLGAPPDADAARSLQELSARGVGVLVAGDLPGARWRLQVDDAGRLTVPELGITVTANRLGEGSLAGLADLISGPDPGGPPEPDPPQGRPPLPPAPAGADDGAWAVAPARVGVLGPVVVRAPGSLDPARREQAAELVAFLALHPGGVHPTVLASSLWPRGVTPDVRDATVARARDWLGMDELGGQRLRREADGRLSLAPDVIVDWDVARNLLARARTVDDPDLERDLLTRALRLVRGPLAGGVAAGRFAWLARTGLERTVPAVLADAAHRLVELLGEADPEGAGEAARLGLRADPGRQELWRDVLRAEHARWGPDGVRTALAELESVFAELGIEADGGTRALVAELVPALALGR